MDRNKTSLGLPQWDFQDKPSMQEFNEAFQKIDAEVGKKADGGKYISVEPTLRTSSNTYNFEYSTRSGGYTLIGDMCIYFFDVSISNMQETDPQGVWVLSLPVPMLNNTPPQPISVSYKDISVYDFSGAYYSGHTIGRTTTKGEYVLLYAQHCDRSVTPRFSGTFIYQWK